MKKELWKFRVTKRVDGNQTEEKDSLGAFFSRVLKRKSFIANVYGEPDVGKSWTTASLCEDTDPRFYKADIISSLVQMYVRLDKGDSSVRQLDDFGSELDKYNQGDELAKATNHLFQKIRTMKVGLFITTPTQMDLNKDTRERRPTYYIEVMDKNEKEGYNLVKVQRIRYNIKAKEPLYYNLKISPSGKLTERGKPHWPKITTFRVMRPTNKLTEWYLPYRTEIGKQQFEKGADVAQLMKTRNQPLKQIAKEIGEHIEDYMTDGLIDESAIRTEYNLGRQKIQDIKYLLRKEGLLGKVRKSAHTRRKP
jgi:hypothetical protein